MATVLRFGLLGVHELPIAFSAVMLSLLSVGAVGGAVAVFDRGGRG